MIKFFEQQNGIDKKKCEDFVYLSHIQCNYIESQTSYLLSYNFFV